MRRNTDGKRHLFWDRPGERPIHLGPRHLAILEVYRAVRCSMLNSVAAVAGRVACYGFTASAADLESSAAGCPSSPRRFSNGSM